MLQDFFKLVQYIENSATALRCLGPPQIVVILLRMTFIIGQTFFIFKSHKVRQDWCELALELLRAMQKSVYK